MDLDKLLRVRGKLKRAVLLHLAERLLSLLRETEGVVRQVGRSQEKREAPSQEEETDSDTKVTSPRWVLVDHEKNRDIIAELSELLDTAIARAKGSNLPPDQMALSDFQRRTLISLLTTALVMLEAPMAEKGLLRKTYEAAENGATSAVKKGTEVGLGLALHKVAEAISKFMTGL